MVSYTVSFYRALSPMHEDYLKREFPSIETRSKTSYFFRTNKPEREVKAILNFAKGERNMYNLMSN